MDAPLAGTSCPCQGTLGSYSVRDDKLPKVSKLRSQLQDETSIRKKIRPLRDDQVDRLEVKWE